MKLMKPLIIVGVVGGGLALAYYKLKEMYVSRIMNHMYPPGVNTNSDLSAQRNNLKSKSLFELKKLWKTEKDTPQMTAPGR